MAYTGCGPLLREIKVETDQGGTEILLPGLLPLPCPTTLLMHPKTTCRRLAMLTVGWALLHWSSVKKRTYGHGHGTF